MEIYAAASKAGFICVPIMFRLAAPEMEYNINHVPNYIAELSGILGGSTEYLEPKEQAQTTIYHVRNLLKRLNRISGLPITLTEAGAKKNKLKEIYNEMQYELMNLDESSKEYSAHHFAAIMKARRHSELLKVPAMVNWIVDMYREGISPVVFVNFRETLESIEKKLTSSKNFDGTIKFDGKISKIIGGQTKTKRDEQIEMFQNDISRVCLVMIPAGAASVSLHDLNGNYPRHTLINPSYSAINTLQALGRCHRANGKTPVIQRFFFAEGVEIEDKMRKRVDLRLTNLDSLNDGDLSLDK